MTTPIGSCPICEKWIALKGDGTLRGHGSRDPYDTWCVGSWQPPVERDSRPTRVDVPGVPKQFDLEDTNEL